MLAAVAATVPRLRPTSMVSPSPSTTPSCSPSASPRWITSAADAVLGMGAGWQVNEHQAYGFDLKEPGERVTHFIEAIQVVRSLLHDERTNIDGTWYHLTDAPFEPKRGGDHPVPLLVGTGSPACCAPPLATPTSGTRGATPRSSPSAPRCRGGLCRGRPRPGSMHRSAQAMLFFADDDAAVQKIATFAPAGRSLVGSGQQLIDLIGGYVELGVDEDSRSPTSRSATHHAQRMDAFARFHSR